jgi:hypothetical protein
MITGRFFSAFVGLLIFRGEKEAKVHRKKHFRAAGVPAKKREGEGV